MSRTFRLSRLINHIMATYILLFVFIPPLQVGNTYRLMAVLATAIWFLTGNGMGRAHISRKGMRFLMLCALCVTLMITVTAMTYGLATAIIRNLQFVIMCIVGYISLYYFENEPQFFDRWMAIALVVICVFSITTIQGLLENPYASRIANSEWLEDRFEGNENVGLYGYVYMCIMLFPMLLYKVLSNIRVNKVFDVFCVIDLVLIAVMTLNAGYMIGLCCLIIGALIVLLLRKATPARIVFTIVLILLLLIAYRPVVTTLFDTAMDLLGDNIVYRQKIADFKLLFLEGSSDGYSVDGRFSNYAASIREIYTFPVFGSYFFGKTLGGGHSAFFDMIGKMGWLVAGLYFYIMWRFPFKIYAPKLQKTNVLKISTMVLLVSFAVFDPYAQEIAITSMVFFPYFLFIADRQAQQKATCAERKAY